MAYLHKPSRAGRPPRGTTPMRALSLLLPEEVIDGLEKEFGEQGLTELVRTGLFHFFAARIQDRQSTPTAEQRAARIAAISALTKVSAPRGAPLPDNMATEDLTDLGRYHAHLLRGGLVWADEDESRDEAEQKGAKGAKGARVAAKA